MATSSKLAITTPTTIVLTTPAPPTQTKNWFDLEVGDCVTEIPAIDMGAVTTDVVDCATPHQAEVYLLAPLAVNTAIDQVASEKCAAGFVAYTGQPFNGSPFAGDVPNRFESGSNRRTIPPRVPPSASSKPRMAAH